MTETIKGFATIHATIWFETDTGEVLGRELEDGEEVTEEELVKTIDDLDCCIVVRGDPGYRHYVNLSTSDDYRHDSFEIPTDLPGAERLWWALENTEHKVLRAMDGEELVLAHTDKNLGPNKSLKVDIDNDDGPIKIVKSLDDDYEIVASESGYRVVEKVEEEAE